MRPVATIAAWLVLASVLGFSTIAAAEKVKTNQKTKMYAHPGEAEKVLQTLDEGKVMTVLNKEGRWLKVRANGLTGYVARSKVDTDDDDVQRNTNRRPFVDGRGTKRGDGGEGPDDRIGADAVGNGDATATANGSASATVTGGGDGGGGGDAVSVTRPHTHVLAKEQILTKAEIASAAVFTATPDQDLFIEGTQGNWTQVSLADGDIGWVLTSKLDNANISVETGGSGITHTTFIARVGLGGALVEQALRTTGNNSGTAPNNYNISSAAATVALGGDLLAPAGKDFIIGGEISFNYNAVTPGVSFMGSTTGITLDQLDARFLAGYDFHAGNGAVLWGRLGYRYQAYLVDNVENLAENTLKLPSEVFQSPTIGLALTIPHLSPRFGIMASADFAVVGTSLVQTTHLDDGLSPDEKEIIIGAGAVFHIKPTWDLIGLFDFTYGDLSFGAIDPKSQRGETGTTVTRIDLFDTLSFGLQHGF